MTNFIIKVLVFLLMLFPNSAYLQGQYQLTIFDTRTTVNSIMDAIETRDINVLEAMMCNNIKQNVDDLPGEIGVLIDTIDGEIITRDWSMSGDFSGAKYGKQIMQTGWTLQFETANEIYFMAVVWEIANNFAQGEMGMRRIAVFNKDREMLAEIIATKGAGGWHD